MVYSASTPDNKFDRRYRVVVRADDITDSQ
jgi:hypothetical protein